MPSRVALVTDSTAMLSPQVREQRGITMVPLQVVVGGTAYDEGLDPAAGPDTVAAALRDRTSVSTSRPTPAVFVEAFERAAERGASSVVSVHLSGELSGTVESAQLAAREVSLPVEVVDTRQLGMGVGFAVLAAADAADAGASAGEVARVATARSRATTSVFYVDTLEFLRRGGRIGAAAALLGSALAVKPLLELTEGVVGTREKVRTAARALARLEEVAVLAAGEREADVAVAHLANEARADLLAANLRRRLADNLAGRSLEVGEVGAVIGAHVGPGMVAVVVSPR